jgi:hypothetical protein
MVEIILGRIVSGTELPCLIDVQAECEVSCRIGLRNSRGELLLYHNVIFVKGLALKGDKSSPSDLWSREDRTDLA